MTTRNRRTTLTAERLREVLSYDPKTGRFSWRVKINRKSVVGHTAGWIDQDGYRVIQIDGKNYRAHRLAWFHFHGVWPANDIDHKDNCPGHDWIDNLRPATRTENHANRLRVATNTTGYKGVTFNKNAGKYLAQIQKDGEHIYLGLFLTAEAAHAAYVAKARELFGDFANDGR